MRGEEPPYEPAQLIHARTMTVQELFAHGDVGLLVPHHHRQYIWNDGQVSRFVGDVCRSGLSHLDQQLFTHPAIVAAVAGPIGDRDSISCRLEIIKEYLDPPASPWG